MAKAEKTTLAGYSYGDIRALERERNAYRFALNTIVFGAFDRPAPRDIRGARSIALKAIVKERSRA